MSGAPGDDLGDAASDGFSFARRALKGLKGSDSKPPEQPKTEKPSADDGGDILKKLVNALKDAPGRVSAVEPPGYGHLLKLRREEAPPLAPGSRGDDVEALQVALGKAGISVPTSGRYDDKTLSAVRRFQEKNGLPADGVFGRETLEKLDEALGLNRGGEAEAAIAPTSGAAKRALPPTGNPFLDSLANGAVRGMHETGFPASVAMAMAVLESGWGERLLARDHNNVFGLRGQGPEGSVMLRDDDGDLKPGGDVAFKKYKRPGDSVYDFMRAFAKADIYRGVMSHVGNAYNFANALPGAFSQDGRYGSLVLRIVQQFDLTRFDSVPKEED